MQFHPISISLSHPTLLMILTFQHMLYQSESVDKAKVVTLYQNLIVSIIEKSQQQDFYHYFIMHYSELISLLSDPATPIANLLLMKLNMLLITMLKSHPSSMLLKITLQVFPSFLIHFHTLQRNVAQTSFPPEFVEVDHSSLLGYLSKYGSSSTYASTPIPTPSENSGDFPLKECSKMIDTFFNGMCHLNTLETEVWKDSRASFLILKQIIEMDEHTNIQTKIKNQRKKKKVKQTYDWKINTIPPLSSLNLVLLLI